MKSVVLLLLLGLALRCTALAAPSSPIDSLRHELDANPADTTRVLLLSQLAAELTHIDPLATIAYCRQALQLAQKIGFRRGEALALIRLGSGFREAGNYPAALQFGLKGLHVAEDVGDAPLVARGLNALGYLNWEQGNSRPALFYLRRAKAVAEHSHADAVLTRILGNIGNVYQQLHQPDSALYYSRQGLALDLRNHDLASEVGDAAMLGNIYASLGNRPQAQHYFRYSLRRSAGFTFALCRAYLGQAWLFFPPTGPPTDSALYFARQALSTARRGNYPRGQFEAAQFLASAQAARHDTAAAFRYLQLANITRDTLFNATKLSQMQALDVSERMRLSELDVQRAQAATNRRQIWLLAALAAAVPALLLLWRYGRLRQRANQQLNAQNAQLGAQRDELRATLARLEETQAQLVQSEKMAFLGELTAGIAHELQNPLAFVKNFADVSALLVDDMSGEPAPASGATDGQELLLAGLRRNLREISQHGQRATSIISSMLARTHGGPPPPHLPTNINALALEYLRLAYQGLRAKDKSFVAARTTHLAPHLPLVPAVAPDLGRVFLNLFSNAFYAVRQRQQRGEAGYAPTVQLSTRLLPSGHVEVRIRDNGPGIPAAVRANIFQPFFTTKKAGEGTGLGLALAHDIVVRDHGGTLTVDSHENEFTEFVICLPVPTA